MDLLVIVLIVGATCVVLMLLLGKSTSSLEERAVVQSGSDNIDPSLSQEISKLHLPPSKSIQVTKAIGRVVDQEVHKQTAMAVENISKSYAKKLDEKDNKMKHVAARFEVANKNLEKVSGEYKTVKKEKKQTEAVVRSIADGLIVVNEKGETLLINPAAEKLLGVTKDEMQGKNLADQAKSEQLITMAQSVEGKEEKEVTYKSKNDETSRILRQSTAVIENEAGQTMGMVTMLTDVTKQKELDALKDKFVSNVTHELRTPLAAIKESVNLFLDKMLGEITQEQEKVLGITKRNITRLSRLIDGVLDISKLESGGMELKVSPFQLSDFISHTLGSFDAWANSKLITLDAKLPPESILMSADQDMLTQVLTNLIGNAFKFTPQGGKISIEVDQKNLSETDPIPALQFGVRDTGPGISQNDQKKIFEKFSQGSAKPVDKIRGTGLGLSISREIVHLHGGRIWVESEEGIGSCFRFIIPEKAAQKEPSKDA